MQITIDPLALTKEQREAVAGFIITFPQSSRHIQGQEIGRGLRIVPEAAFGGGELPSDPIPTPEVAFGGVKPSQVISVDAGLTTGSIDKSGLPWDERIHSSNRALTADGFWRKRRGVDDATVATVEAQLKQLMAIPRPTNGATLPIADAPSQIFPSPTASVSQIPLPPASVAEVIPTVASSAPSAIPTAMYTPDTAGFLALISRASALMGEKKLTQEEVTAACTSIGIPSFPLAGQRTDLIPQLGAIIEATVSGRA